MDKQEEYQELAADLYQAVGVLIFEILEKNDSYLFSIPEEELIKIMDNLHYIANHGNGIKHENLLPFPKLDKK